MGFLDREIKLLGEEVPEKFKEKKILLFGVGGVGSYALEGLVRSGFENITIVDKDIVDETNINRQLVAYQSTIGKEKVEVAKERALDINPNCNIKALTLNFSEETENNFDFSDYDFVIDAIDDVKAKLRIIELAKLANTNIISSMGMGNKLDPTQIQIADIEKTHMDPLAKVIRLGLRKKRLKKVPVVFSTEQPYIKTTPPGSLATVPSVAGLTIASYIINSIIKEINE